MTIQNRAAWRETPQHVAIPPRTADNRGRLRVSIWQCGNCLRTNRQPDVECVKCGRPRP